MLCGHGDLAYTDWTLGLSDDDSFKTSIRALVSLLKTPGGREYWCRYGPNNSTPFYNYMNEHCGRLNKSATCSKRSLMKMQNPVFYEFFH